jgi:predicted secreted protein
MKFARDLLILKICPFINEKNEIDLDVFGTILGMKIKSQQAATHIEAISLIVRDNPNMFAQMALRCFLQYEILPMSTRPMNNFKNFQQILKALPCMLLSETFNNS